MPRYKVTIATHDAPGLFDVSDQRGRVVFSDSDRAACERERDAMNALWREQLDQDRP